MDFRGEAGATGHLAFDHLVLATGAPTAIPAWARDGRSLISGVHRVKDLDDGAAWLDLLVRVGTGNARPEPRRAVADAPPFATVRDAIQLAARRLADRLGKAHSPGELAPGKSG